MPKLYEKSRFNKATGALMSEEKISAVKILAERKKGAQR